MTKQLNKRLKERNKKNLPYRYKTENYTLKCLQLKCAKQQMCPYYTRTYKHSLFLLFAFKRHQVTRELLSLSPCVKDKKKR